jgi:nucleoside-diphosphate-sugar epimerase
MILVTGGTGFIGRHLIRHLLHQGLTVRALIRQEGRLQDLKGPELEFFRGDLTQPATLKHLTRGVETVFHLAGLINAPREDKEVYWQSNVRGTRNLLLALEKEGQEVKKFVFCSSVGVMGPLETLPADEGQACSPRNLYEQSKHESEEVVRTFRQQKGLPVTIVRPSWVYGPGDQRTLKLFRAVQRRRFVMIGNGRTLIHPVHVEDVVQGLERAALTPAAEGQTYIIAGENALPLIDLVRLIARLLQVPLFNFHLPLSAVRAIAAGLEILYKPLNRKPPLFPRRLEFFIKNQSFTIAKAKKDLGYQPKFDIERGLAETLGWYQRHGFLDASV